MFHLFDELERLFLVLALIIIVAQPRVDLILTENAILFLGGIIVCHYEIAQKPEWLLIDALQRLGDLPPVHVELLELAPVNLAKHHVFQKIHRIEALTSLIDSLKYLERISNIMCLDPDKARNVEKKSNKFPELCEIRELLFQEIID